MAVAVLHSWDATFCGNTAEILLMTISAYLDKQRHFYAHFATMVNSSGTGKSHMVDQVAMKVITIPMCLCDHEHKGEHIKGMRFHVNFIHADILVF